MTFNAAIPLNGDSPGIFPSQCQTNMARLQTLLGADHQFNLSAAADDGYHNLVHLTQQAPSGALAATGRVYAQAIAGKINLFYMNDAGGGFQITPTIPIYAAVNFFGNPTTIRFSHNVSSVTRNDKGLYTINFINPLPSNNYVVTGMCMRDTSNALMQVKSDSNYANSVSQNFVKINTFDLDGNNRDVTAAFVLICGG